MELQQPTYVGESSLLDHQLSERLIGTCLQNSMRSSARTFTFRIDTHALVPPAGAGHVWLAFDGKTCVRACVACEEPSVVVIVPLEEHPTPSDPGVTDERGPAAGECRTGYEKRGRARIHGGDIDIMAFGCVDERAISICSRTVEQMLRDASSAVCQRLIKRRISIAVIGRAQKTSDMPPHSFLRDIPTVDGRSYDDGCRGVGGTCSVPCTSVGEENLLMLAEDEYPQESILVHEFGHCVMNCGFDDSLAQRLVALYGAAVDAGGHGDLSTYMMSNTEEYWAEMTQAWFHATVRSDVNNGIRTRADVKKQDAGVARLLADVYGDGGWIYTSDCPNVAKWELKKQGLTANLDVVAAEAASAHPHHGIDYVEFTAPDLSAVKAFYSEVFGWRFTAWGDGYMAFTGPGLGGGFERGVAKPGGALMILFSRDLEATLSAVQRAGGTISKGIFAFPGGRRFQFTDPAGYELAVWSDANKQCGQV